MSTVHIPLYLPPNFLLWIPRAFWDRDMFSTVDHDQPFHVAVDLSGPHYFSQWENLVLNLANPHCEINLGCRSLFFIFSTVDLHNRYSYFTIWNCGYTRTSMVCEIDQDHRSDQYFISVVKGFFSLFHFSIWKWGFGRACSLAWNVLEPLIHPPINLSLLFWISSHAISAPTIFFFSLHLW